MIKEIPFLVKRKLCKRVASTNNMNSMWHLNFLRKTKFAYLIAILVIGLVYLAVVWYICKMAPSPSPSMQPISKEELLDQAQTGDLLFFSGDTVGEKVVKWWTKCQWSHVGMVFRSGSAVLLWEVDVGQTPREGPRVIKLDEKMDRYGGVKVGGWKKRDVPLDNKALTTAMAPLLGKKMDTVMSKWMFANVPSVYKLLKSDNKIFCSEGMCETLKNIGDIPEDVVCGGMSPKDFVDIPGYGEMTYFSLE